MRVTVLPVQVSTHGTVLGKELEKFELGRKNQGRRDNS